MTSIATFSPPLRGVTTEDPIEPVRIIALVSFPATPPSPFVGDRMEFMAAWPDGGIGPLPIRRVKLESELPSEVTIPDDEVPGWNGAGAEVEAQRG